MTKVIGRRLLLELRSKLLFLYNQGIRKEGGICMYEVEVVGLYKMFKDNVALNGVSIEIEKGEIFGLLGPNGAGKSTLIRILSMLSKANKGSVNIADYHFEKDEIAIKNYIGVVPQELAIFEELTAYENVHFFGGLYGLKGRQLKESVSEALAFVGLEDKAKKKAKTFSGGMKRRLNIACSLVHKPQLIIMDEPTVGIDPQSRNYILESIKKLNKEGRTIIYTTHYMEEAETLCDRIAIIDRGNIIAVGTTRELEMLIEDRNTVQIGVKDISLVDEKKILQIKGVEKVHFEGNQVTITSEKEVTTLDKIIEVMTGTGTRITGVEMKNRDLEDVFLNLTGRGLRD